MLGEADETTMITLGLEHTHWWNFFRFCIFFNTFSRAAELFSLPEMLEEGEEQTLPGPTSSPPQSSLVQFIIA